MNRASAMGIDIEYLHSYLQDEFKEESKDHPELRIYIVLPSGTRKSPDLPQDYDPNEGQVHLRRGVNVKVSSRIYFFPAFWVENNQLDRVHEQVEEIRRFLGI